MTTNREHPPRRRGRPRGRPAAGRYWPTRRGLLALAKAERAKPAPPPAREGNVIRLPLAATLRDAADSGQTQAIPRRVAEEALALARLRAGTDPPVAGAPPGQV